LLVDAPRCHDCFVVIVRLTSSVQAVVEHTLGSCNRTSRIRSLEVRATGAQTFV
jgi:hypothetical protein